MTLDLEPWTLDHREYPYLSTSNFSQILPYFFSSHLPNLSIIHFDLSKAWRWRFSSIGGIDLATHSTYMVMLILLLTFSLLVHYFYPSTFIHHHHYTLFYKYALVWIDIFLLTLVNYLLYSTQLNSTKYFPSYLGSDYIITILCSINMNVYLLIGITNKLEVILHCVLTLLVGYIYGSFSVEIIFSA